MTVLGTMLVSFHTFSTFLLLFCNLVHLLHQTICVIRSLNALTNDPDSAAPVMTIGVGFLVVVPMKICTGELQFVDFFSWSPQSDYCFLLFVSILWSNLLGKSQIILKQFPQLHWN